MRANSNLLSVLGPAEYLHSNTDRFSEIIERTPSVDIDGWFSNTRKKISELIDECLEKENQFYRDISTKAHPIKNAKDFEEIYLQLNNVETGQLEQIFAGVIKTPEFSDLLFNIYKDVFLQYAKNNYGIIF